MNLLFQLFAHPLFEAIGWALLHSVWQGLLIALLLRLILNFVPSRKATLRYGISLAGLATVMLAGTATVWFMIPDPAVSPDPSVRLAPLSIIPAATATVPMLTQVATYIESQIPLILTLWIAGVVVFSLRLTAGWMYFSRLKNTAVPVSDSWYDLMDRLANQLGLTQFIQLCESANISAPVVAGIFKPVILVPIGMFAGLSPQQVEAVLLHELTHIRRHDFLINLAQSVIEVVYFFNPFVWIISATVRNEREFCCDDEVVRQYNPRIYAEALAYLETNRAAKTALALSLTGGKNNLLYRIKRFMERSKQNHPVPQWLAPLMLAAIGILGMSWMTIGNDPARDKAMIQAAATFGTTMPGGTIIPKDTIGDPNEKSATYSIRKTITIDENGEPHEEIVKEFEGDEEFRDIMDSAFNFDYELALDSSLFAYSYDFDTLIDMDLFEEMPDFHFEEFSFPDSLPHSPGSRRWNPEEFRYEFETMFKEKFSDFYKEHEEDMEAMMNQLEEKFNRFREDTVWQRNLRRNMYRMKRNMQRLEENMEKMHKRMEGMPHKDGKAMIEHDRAMEHHARMLEAQHAMKTKQHMHLQHLASVKAAQQMAEEIQVNVVAKQKMAIDNLREELVKDGYLKKDEPLRSLTWSNDALTVNGKDVKPKDVKRYQKLNEKWMK